MADRRALIISTDIYDDPTFRELRSPAADAEALRAILGNTRIGNYDVQVLRNVAKSDADEAIDDFFGDALGDDTLLLYVTGHGTKNDYGELHFVMRNTLRQRLSSRALSATFVRQSLDASRSRQKLVILDCCFSGAFPAGRVHRAGETADVFSLAPQGKGCAILTASSSLEYSYEPSGQGITRHGTPPVPSFFTSALVDGLRSGDADMGGDGYVDVQELYDYLYSRMLVGVSSAGRQTPQLKNDVEGRLVVASSPRGKVLASREETPRDRPKKPTKVARKDLETVLLTERDIHERIGGLASALDKDYTGKRPLMVCLLKGAIPFVTALGEQMAETPEVEYMHVRALPEGRNSAVLRMIKNVSVDLTDRNVIVVDNLIKTGLTMSYALTHLRARSPASMEVCSLLRCPDSLKVEVGAKYVGFDVPVLSNMVGFGEDFNEDYRGLPYIGMLDPTVVRQVSSKSW